MSIEITYRERDPHTTPLSNPIFMEDDQKGSKLIKNRFLWNSYNRVNLTQPMLPALKEYNLTSKLP